MKKILISTCLFIVNVSLVFSQQVEPLDWNQFRGQNRNGISLETDIPDRHSEVWPKLVWKKEIGSAFSEVTVTGNKLYTMFCEMSDSVSGLEYLAAYNAGTGDEIWRAEVDSVFVDVDGWGNGPRSTPTFDEEYIYSLSASGKLTANKRIDGKELWQVDFVKEYGSVRPRWGFSTSPLLIDDLLLMEVGGTDSRAFAAFDKKTGKVVWSKANGAAYYNSPLRANIDGQKQIIFANGNTIFSYNTKGDTLWTFKSPIVSPMGMPVVIEQNRIFISAIRSIGFIIIEINDNKAKEVLRGSNMKTDFSSCVYYNGNVYGFHIAALQCISAETGEKKWTKRGFGKGSFILVNNKLLVLSDKGKLIQVEATGEAYKEQASFQAIEGKSWTAPSYSKGKLYVRNLTQMACFDLK